MTTQPQLLPLSLNGADVVYTPDWVAKDMVEWFKPSGRILEPSAGDGVFLRYLPEDTLWCEIEKGRDFFAFNERVDWIVGNPPYSIFTDWMKHSLSITDEIVYAVPLNKPFNSPIVFEAIMKWGCIAHIRYYCKAREISKKFDFGFSVAAIHFSKSATCTTYSRWAP
jgi:hypothetical protein